MSGPSKEERKRLRQQAEQAARAVEFCSHIVSPTATIEDSNPAQIIQHAAEVCVALEHRPTDEGSHAFGILGEGDPWTVTIDYTDLSGDIIDQAAEYDWLFDDADKLQLGMPTISLRAQVSLDPVIDFLHQTVLRVLGRLTHGILFSAIGEYVGDDWQAWSLDYYEPDMFEVTRVYDESCPEFSSLLERFPTLRA